MPPSKAQFCALFYTLLMAIAILRIKPKMYYFYILRCSDNSLYCGQSNNLERRIKEHNFDKHKSAKYLRGKTPVKLVYCEEYLTLQLAMKREWQVKRWTKRKKETLISENITLVPTKFEESSGFNPAE